MWLSSKKVARRLPQKTKLHVSSPLRLPTISPVHAVTRVVVEVNYRLSLSAFLRISRTDAARVSQLLHALDQFSFSLPLFCIYARTLKGNIRYRGGRRLPPGNRASRRLLINCLFGKSGGRVHFCFSERADATTFSLFSFSCAFVKRCEFSRYIYRRRDTHERERTMRVDIVRCKWPLMTDAERLIYTADIFIWREREREERSAFFAAR